MGLAVGSKLGPYEILSPLGAGGMGEVYRARDAKLNREVALKVLPSAFANDAQRMARFQREAQVLASLNHPNIATIHGLEESGSTRALVMELVEGETLAERLKSGSLSADDALPLARQIAEALEYAHDKGVVHRDLKPANIKITPEGAVKVLDFGLAKALLGDAASSSSLNSPTLSPTLSAAATQAGVILGTAAYMSPEQAKGKSVDRRTDIWAFGCVLFEMLTGGRGFDGETVSDVLAAVIMREPDWSALPTGTPPRISELIRRCLNKDPKQRLQAIGEARIAIEETIAGVGPDGVRPLHEVTEGERRSPLRSLPWALAGLVLGALITGFVFWKFAAPAPQRSPIVASVLPPPNLSLGPMAISPDGTQLAFAAADAKGAAKLYVRPLDSSESKAIPGTEDAIWPFWSPDGGSLGFFSDGKLKTVSLSSGSVQVLTDAGCWGDAGAWSPNGTILFTPSCNTPLYKVSSSGGNPVPATKLQNGEHNDGLPAFLPDGHHFLYVPNAYIPTTHSVWVGLLDSSERKLVLKDASSPAFVSGHLLFTRNNRVFAQPFDPSTGKVSGKAVALTKALTYSVSEAGVLAYQGGTSQARLEWYGRDGNLLGTVGPVAAYPDAKISPDGKRILTEEYDPGNHSFNLLSFPSTGGPGTRLTFGAGTHFHSVWSPDGKYIAYSCQSKGRWGICRKPSDGSGAEERLITFGAEVRWAQAIDWSPDGRYLSFDKFNSKFARDEVWVLPLFGDRKPFRPAPVDVDQANGAFSPDGHWLAYGSSETGRYEIYVVSFPGLGAKFQISQNGGISPRWDKKGHLYFRATGNRLMQADLDTSGKSLRVKALHPLFQWTPPSLAIAWNKFYDVSADGSRFLVIQSTDPNASRSIGLLLNWQSKLKGKE